MSACTISGTWAHHLPFYRLSLLSCKVGIPLPPPRPRPMLPWVGQHFANCNVSATVTMEGADQRALGPHAAVLGSAEGPANRKAAPGRQFGPHKRLEPLSFCTGRETPGAQHGLGPVSVGGWSGWKT